MFSTTRRLTLCAAALALAAAACTSASSVEAQRVRRSDVKVLPGVVHPLTGIEAGTTQPWQSRPVLAIKIGNSPAERPQAGVDQADLVYEEIVEGGVTRFMAIFSTNDVPRVGPVRSARKVDPTLLTPLNGLFGYSGAAPSTLGVVGAASGITDVGVDRAANAYHRDGNRNAPYNLYTSTRELWSGRTGAPPGPQFSFLKEGDDPGIGGAEVANQIAMSFSGNGQTRYVYRPENGRYERLNGESPHLAEGSVPLSFRNVVVQTVQISAGTSIDKAGFRSSDIATTGSGTVIVFRGGKALRGRWERNSVSEPTRFLDDAGQPIRLSPGKTLIELLPQDRAVTIS